MRYIMFGVSVFLCAIISLPIMAYSKIFHKEDEFYYKFLKPAFTFIIKSCNVKVNVHGTATGIKNTMLVANHTSLFDILVLVSVMEDRYIFVSKKGNKYFPIISWWMMMNDTLFIDRDKLKVSIRQMQTVTKFIKNGRNVAIFPQGTRNSENIEFKPGTLKFAIKAKGNILPVGLKGGEKIFSPFSFKRKYVDVYINDIITYEEYFEKKSVVIQKEIEEKIKEQVLN